jgi:L-iditol 2-dehydrogenase
VDAVHEVTSGRGVDVVIEAAGVDVAITTGVQCARPGGRLALAGIPSTPVSSFPAAPARRKGLTFAMVRRMRNTYPRAIELATSGIDLDSLVSARFPLSEAADAFAYAAARHGDKVVVSPAG